MSSYHSTSAVDGLKKRICKDVKGTDLHDCICKLRVPVKFEQEVWRYFKLVSENQALDTEKEMMNKEETV